MCSNFIKLHVIVLTCYTETSVTIKNDTKNQLPRKLVFNFENMQNYFKFYILFNHYVIQTQVSYSERNSVPTMSIKHLPLFLLGSLKAFILYFLSLTALYYLGTKYFIKLLDNFKILSIAISDIRTYLRKNKMLYQWAIYVM